MDLFDMVRNAPPPKAVREYTGSSQRKTPIKQIADSAKTDPTTKCLLLASSEGTEVSDDDIEIGSTQPSVRQVGKMTSSLGKKSNSKTIETNLIDGNDDDDGDDADDDVNDGNGTVNADKAGEDEQPQPMPFKTKAQQKMFAELPLPSKHQQQIGPFHIKPCIVRINRLTQSKIDHLTATISKKKSNKRGRPRKSAEASTAINSPKPNSRNRNRSNKVHIAFNIEIPRLSISSKQSDRVHTPPPNLIRSPNNIRPPFVRREMVRRYGARFFNCVVKVKRIRDFNSSLPKRINNKSVSFSEAVEILGSKPRKSSSTSGGDKCHSVPTRLQRVDATGNVLEDINLGHNMSLKFSRTKLSHNKRSAPSSCNGGRSAKLQRRQSTCVPVTGLASLCIEDSQDEPASNEPGVEYIVPNDVSDNKSEGVRCARTSSPVKRFSSTTTVSDEEDTEESTKANTMKEEPTTKKPKSSSTMRNASNKEPKSPIKNQKSPAKEKKSSTMEKQSSPKENQEQAEHMGKQLQSELKPQPVEPVLNAADPEPTPELEKPATVPGHIELREVSPFALAIIEDVTSTDDILEIQKSDQDVRDLYTPTSRQTTPELLRRLESPVSDCSFKSAIETVGNRRALHIVDRIPSPASPLRQISTPSTLRNGSTPPAAPNTLNSSASSCPASSKQASTTTATTTKTIITTDTNTTTTNSNISIGSPIGEIPNLGDELCLWLTSDGFHQQL
ncbi:uncharacterized protein LOC6564831 isoform X2 [Drosophila grimshawi]|uniref:uncharacterized protein LOC6564831 isoform X2 n=1 Tax=Drosophila grimshawi TaxID=7222 RepID=UPI000C86F06E|nr:uncharacterized protein LOC6564831 isoform X2 [Drosophila grimshawi]